MSSNNSITLQVPVSVKFGRVWKDPNKKHKPGVLVQLLLPESILRAGRVFDSLTPQQKQGLFQAVYGYVCRTYPQATAVSEGVQIRSIEGGYAAFLPFVKN